MTPSGRSRPRGPAARGPVQPGNAGPAPAAPPASPGSTAPGGARRRRGRADAPSGDAPAAAPSSGRSPSSAPPSAPRRRPAALVAVCALVLVEAGVLVGLAGAWVLELVRGTVQLPGATVFLALFALGVAGVLVLAVRGLWQGRRWARSPVMTWQVLLVVLAVSGFGDDPSPWVLAMLALGLLVGIGLVLPPVVAVTLGRPDRR
ncbi:hypothetical protein [uncultured Cellulomonas sp.]|uniref:hypothetical protein n=1 Tax=uncultured Cellulomonas sp. TaxID=189682 RepID=UPI00262182BA|nr:hypothetical protein [uncultured Cellulomonas sp.]